MNAQLAAEQTGSAHFLMVEHPSFPNIFNQNFKEMDRPFKISKILQIVMTLVPSDFPKLNFL